MFRLALFGLLVVAALVAYPWAAVGLVALVVVIVVVSRVRTRKNRPAVKRGGVPLDRRVALRAAWRDLHEIERAAGLSPSPKE